MGTLKNGVFGGVNGSVANLVSYQLNGQHVIRSKPQPKKKQPSRKQYTNQGKWKLTTTFIKGMDGFAKPGLSPFAKGTTLNWHNLAMKFNRLHAVKGNYPDLEIDYSKVVLSKGPLLPAENPAAQWVEHGLKITWDKDSTLGWPEMNDQVMLLAYAVGQKKYFTVLNGEKRSNGWDTIEIPANLRHDRFELYLYFIADDRLQASDTQYIGSIEG
ncbi:DUF6266 family protein [Pedobacter sp.]|uniref:DUF6266 family protein n=1 Tax=Pedobacter sp. TaxID=1411316 RepID=UPI003D7F74C6